jgi:hypothetical protein
VLLLLDFGDTETASPIIADALAVSMEHDLRFVAWFVYARGLAELDADQCELASATFDQARRHALAVGDKALAASARANGALATRAQGCLREARAELCHAIDEFRGTDEHHFYGAVARAIIAAIEADLDRLDAARTSLADAARDLPMDDASPYHHLAKLCAAHVDLAEARRALADGDPRRSAECRTRARAAVSAARTPRPPSASQPSGAAAATDCLFDVRWAVRTLERTLAGAHPPDVERPTHVRLEAAGRWLEVPGRPPLSCQRRPVMRRLLLALANARLESPGRVVPALALIDAGWPGERILPQPARDRLQMMISRMRDVGLRDAIRADEDGYYLDPAFDVEIVADCD